MPGRLALLGLLVVVVSLGGCSRRERSNPFDPANPRTGGRPTGFVALAGDGVVSLRWQAASGPGLEGYQIFRRTGASSGYAPISSILRTAVTSFVDADVINGTDYQYRLYFVFLDDRPGLPAEDIATPGRLKVWVAEAGAGRVARLTPDGRHVVNSYVPFSGPTYLAVNDRTAILWVSDVITGEIVLLQPSTGSRAALSGGTSPGAIALDPIRGEGWVCDPPGGIVHHFAESGARLFPQLGPLDDPLAIAVDPHDGSVWVCENAGNRVRRFSRSGTSMVSWPTHHPSRVAVDSLTRDAWVTSLDQGRVFRLDALGIPQVTVTVARGPVGVAVDHRRGRVWIADPAGSQVFVLDREGGVLGVASGIAGAAEVDVDLVSGEAWVTSPSLGQVVRVSAAGSIVRRLGGFLQPYGISLSGNR